MNEHLLVPSARIARESQANEYQFPRRDDGDELSLVSDGVKGVYGQRLAVIAATLGR